MQKEKGSALLMTVCLTTVLFLLLGALLPMMADEARASGYNSNYLIAQAAADAAANYEIQRIQRSLTAGVVPNDRRINPTKLSNTSSAWVECESKLFDTNGSKRIEIRANATCGSSSANASVNIYLDDSSPIVYPGTTLEDLINTGSYSHQDHNPKGGDPEIRWKIEKEYDAQGKLSDMYAIPTGDSQVMFSSTFKEDTFKISYKASAILISKDEYGRVTGGGYGIYYGMIGNADNMNAYVVQYDPGATHDEKSGYSVNYGSLVIKKVIFDPGNMDPNTEATSDNFQHKIWDPIDNAWIDSPGWMEKNEWNTYSKRSENWACPFEEAEPGEVLRVPLAEDDDSVNSLQKLMGGKAKFDIYEPHIITIETKMVNGRLWHYIYFDQNPNPILKFYDHSKEGTDAAGYKLESFKGTHTGLRVWANNVDVKFQDMSSLEEGSGQISVKSIVWVR